MFGKAIPMRSDRVLYPFSCMNSRNPSHRSSMIRKPYCITAVHICRFVQPSSRKSRASRQVSIPPIPLIGILPAEGSLASSCMNRRAIGRTAFPRIAGHAAQSGMTTGRAVSAFSSIRVIHLMVLMAAIPVAPPSWAASATGVICPIFGVIFASIGRWVPRRVGGGEPAYQSGFVLRRCHPSCVICGQEKLHSMISAPAAWNIGQAVSTHRLSVP